MLRFWLLLLGAAGGVWAEPGDRVEVTVEKRGGREWCVVDAQVSTLAPSSLETLAAVVQDYGSYPRLFPRIVEAHAESIDEAVLVTQTMVVEALGLRNVYRFTLRMTVSRSESAFRLSWTQELTDGSIDSLRGSWTLEKRGTGTRTTYRTRYAVPSVVFGQDLFMRMVMGGELRKALDAVVKSALDR